MKKNSLPSKRTASYQAHKRDYIWQILVPIITALILMIVASVSVAMGSDAYTSRWADISIIWIIIPLLLFAFLSLIVLIGLIYGMTILLNVTSIHTQKVYILIRLVAEKIESAADLSAQPIFFVEGISATIKKFFQQK